MGRRTLRVGSGITSADRLALHPLVLFGMGGWGVLLGLARDRFGAFPCLNSSNPKRLLPFNVSPLSPRREIRRLAIQDAVGVDQSSSPRPWGLMRRHKALSVSCGLSRLGCLPGIPTESGDSADAGGCGV